MHFCVNLVCLLQEDSASAVLLRAGAIVAGEELARARRTRGATPVASRDLARGPARLCQALGIDLSLDGADACTTSSPLRIRAAHHARSARIMAGPRVGISRATEFPWRFWLEGDPTVSPYRAHVPRKRKLVTP
jgi:DNA-3-methyladenine glycosylase